MSMYDKNHYNTVKQLASQLIKINEKKNENGLSTYYIAGHCSRCRGYMVNKREKSLAFMELLS